MSKLTINEFADRMGEIMPVLGREFASKHMGEFGKVKLTIPQVFIMEFLSSQGESKMSDLAKSMRVTTANMTGLVERLVRSGCVERVFDPQDRRIIKVRLTRQGETNMKKISDHRREAIIKVFGKISDGDREDYLRILMQIKDILLQEDNELKIKHDK